ncbi:MAG: hypothetical protein HY721_30710, partial [Planctomycetes bacterium]|nr:hypothetical protein [Planctomycetota bacterium]
MGRPAIAGLARLKGSSGWCGALAAFLLGAGGVGATWQYAGGPVERDVYFHLAIAEDYAASPFSYSTKLAEGLLSRHTADREYLFHLALAGLLRLGIPDLKAAQVLCALLAGALGAILYGHSRSLIVVACGLLGSSTSFYRLLMCRPQLFAVACVTLGTVFLLRDRHRLAALVNLVYTVSYSVPVLLVAAASLHALQARKLRGLLWVASASVVGLVLHPHSPSNLVVLWYQGYQVTANALAGNPAGIPMPAELLPWSLDRFLVDAWLPLVLLALGGLRRTTPWWLLVLQILLLALSLRSIRFIEYWVPLVAVSAGPTVRCLLPQGPQRARWAVVGLFVAACPVLSLRDAALTARKVAPEQGIYRGAAAWLSGRARGEYVFNAEWDAYPELRRFGGTFSIAQGQDPLFIAACDEKRYRRIADAVAGKLPPEELRKAFPARFIVARRGSSILRYESLAGAPIVFEDEHVVVL